MTSQQVESLKTIPVPTPELTHDNITEEELNQAPQDSKKSPAYQVNDQLNDPKIMSQHETNILFQRKYQKNNKKTLDKNVSLIEEIAGNKVKGRILKRVFLENKARKFSKE